MHNDIEEWCLSCDICCAKRAPKRRGRAPLLLNQVGAPVEIVAINTAGPQPVTKVGDKYICVAMDYFTKWPKAYTIPN